MQAAASSLPESEAGAEYGDQWPDQLEMNFGVSLSDAEGIAWMRDIERKFPNVNNAEIVRAIDWASDDRNWKRRGRPDLSDLRKWLGINRARNRTFTPEAPKQGCELCHRGDVEVWPELPDQPASVSDFDLGYSVSVPCRCDAGIKRMPIFRQGNPRAGDWPERMFDKARRQLAHRDKLLAEKFGTGTDTRTRPPTEAVAFADAEGLTNDGA